MQDDIQLTPSPDAPDANSAQPDENSASSDTDIGGERIFDITDDLNISPAKDVAVKTFPVKMPQAPARPAPAAPSPIIQKPFSPFPEPTDAPSVRAKPLPAQPLAPAAPRKPLNIPLTDFSEPLEKAKTIGSANPSFADFGKVTKLPLEIGKDPVAQNPNLKPLRTYEGDVAEVLAHTKTSTASIAIAETKKQQGEEQLGNSAKTDESSHMGKKLILGLISLLLIGGGAAAAYYFYSKSPLAPVPSQTPTAPVITSLIPADGQEALRLNGLTPPATLSQIKAELAKSGAPGTITELIPVQTINGVTTRLSAQDMLNFMEIAPPDILSRSLNQQWMLGIYQDAGGARSAFVIVSINFFQNAFAGMLQWESIMADDLKQYLIPGTAEDIANTPVESTPVVLATSTNTTASTSAVTASIPPASTSYSVQGHFVDRIIMNKDVRAFQTNDGKTLFLYSFIDNTKLVVAGNEAALIEILDRLEKQAFVR